MGVLATGGNVPARMQKSLDFSGFLGRRLLAALLGLGRTDKSRPIDDPQVDAEDRLVGLDPPFTETRVEIIRANDGTAEWLRFGSRIHKRIK